MNIVLKNLYIPQYILYTRTSLELTGPVNIQVAYLVYMYENVKRAMNNNEYQLCHYPRNRIKACVNYVIVHFPMKFTLCSVDIFVNYI